MRYSPNDGERSSEKFGLQALAPPRLRRTILVGVRRSSTLSARISFASASELKSSVSSTSSRRRALNDSIQGFCQGEPGSM